MANRSTITAVRPIAAPTVDKRLRRGYRNVLSPWMVAPIGASFAGRRVPISEGRAVSWHDTC